MIIFVLIMNTFIWKNEYYSLKNEHLSLKYHNFGAQIGFFCIKTFWIDGFRIINELDISMKNFWERGCGKWNGPKLHRRRGDVLTRGAVDCKCPNIDLLQKMWLRGGGGQQKLTSKKKKKIMNTNILPAMILSFLAKILLFFV